MTGRAGEAARTWLVHGPGRAGLRPPGRVEYLGGIASVSCQGDGYLIVFGNTTQQAAGRDIADARLIVGQARRRRGPGPAR